MIRAWSTQSIESWLVSWSARRPIRACWRSSCSAARSAARPPPGSDVDVCLVLSSPVNADAAFRTKLSYSGVFDVDLVLFHELPLHIRRRVSREGKVLFTRDEERLYEVAIQAAREFEDFKHIQRAYLDEVARG